MSYTENYVITSHDVDKNFNIKPSVVMRYMQETANHHMREAKPSYNDLYEQGKSFILSRMNILLYGKISQYDRIRITTWPTNKGVMFLRSYQMKSGEVVLAEGTAIFALIDINTNRFIRSTELDLSNYGDEPPLGSTLDKKARIPDGVELIPRGVHKVAYYETDLNGHVNNTNYPDILANYIPDIDKLGTVKAMTFHFANEAKLGCEMEISVSDPVPEKNAAKFYIRSVAEEKTNVIAEMSFSS